MKYDLMYCCLGNGLSVCNRAVEEHGDYKKVAHISHDRNVTFYDKKLPENIKSDIISVAKTDDSSMSTSQPDAKIFSIPPAKFKVGEKVVFTNDYGVKIRGEKTIIGMGLFIADTDLTLSTPSTITIGVVTTQEK